MNRRKFLKKSLGGIVVGIPLISSCSKNPLKSETNKKELPEYAPGALIIKFSEPAFLNKDFNIRLENNTVITGLKSIDSLNTYYKAESFKYFSGRDREFIFQFPANSDMKYVAGIYSKNLNVESASPNWLYYTQ